MKLKSKESSEVLTWEFTQHELIERLGLGKFNEKSINYIELGTTMSGMDSKYQVRMKITEKNGDR